VLLPLQLDLLVGLGINFMWDFLVGVSLPGHVQCGHGLLFKRLS